MQELQQQAKNKATRFLIWKSKVSWYVSICIKKFDDGTHGVSQKGWTNKILKLKMTDCKPNLTPTTQVALGLDPGGESCDHEDWDYRSASLGCYFTYQTMVCSSLRLVSRGTICMHVYTLVPIQWLNFAWNFCNNQNFICWSLQFNRKSNVPTQTSTLLLFV